MFYILAYKGWKSKMFLKDNPIIFPERKQSAEKFHALHKISFGFLYLISGHSVWGGFSFRRKESLVSEINTPKKISANPKIRRNVNSS